MIAQIHLLCVQCKTSTSLGDSRSEKILKFFHLVKSLGPNEWENACTHSRYEFEMFFVVLKGSDHATLIFRYSIGRISST